MDMSAFYDTLKEIYLHLDDGDRRFLGQFRLTVPRFFLLRHINENPGISPTQLSALMLNDKSNITRLLRGVEDEGLVKRRPDQHDRRTIQLYLTRKGEGILSEAQGAHAAFNRHRFSQVRAELEQVSEVLSEIRSALEAQLAQMDA